MSQTCKSASHVCVLLCVCACKFQEQGRGASGLGARCNAPWRGGSNGDTLAQRSSLLKAAGLIAAPQNTQSLDQTNCCWQNTSQTLPCTRQSRSAAPHPPAAHPTQAEPVNNSASPTCTSTPKTQACLLAFHSLCLSPTPQTSTVLAPVSTTLEDAPSSDGTGRDESRACSSCGHSTCGATSGGSALRGEASA